MKCNAYIGSQTGIVLAGESLALVSKNPNAPCCGYELEHGDVFCPLCGARGEMSSETYGIPPDNSKFHDNDELRSIYTTNVEQTAKQHAKSRAIWEAVKWFLRAAEQGNEDVENALKLLEAD